MPFLSTRLGLERGTEAAGKLIAAGADSVKIEGADGNLELISHLVESGIPVMGHLGLTRDGRIQSSGTHRRSKGKAH